MELPQYVEDLGGVLYCFLKGELDKASFEDQCGGCPLKNNCITKNEIYKNVSGDWHSLNASGLYGSDFDNCTDKFKRKDFRDIAKIVGLALCYGGSAYTVSGNMRTSKEEAQEKIDNFYRKLTTLNIYMLLTKKKVLETGKAYNLFSRIRDMSKWAFSVSWKDKLFAQRVALNHPIQSTSAELLKIMMIRVDDYIEANKLSLLYGLQMPQKIDLETNSYRDMVLHELMSTHDEVDYLFKQDRIDDLLPIIYEIMQVHDVMAAFNVGFTLELDCEYDTVNRSLIHNNAYMGSKIYVVNKLRQNKMVGGENLEPNTIIIDFDNVNAEFIANLAQFSCNDETKLYNLVVNSDQGIYFHQDRFSLDFIKRFNINYRLAYIG